MIFIILVLIIFQSSDICANSSNDSMQSTSDEEKLEWTKKLDNMVTNIYYETESKHGSHEKNMKEVWDRIVPQFKGVKADYLRRRALNLIYKLGDNKAGRAHLTPKLESDLIQMYIRLARSGTKGVTYKLHEEFYSKYPNVSRILPLTLWERARRKYRALDPESAEELRMRNFWDSDSKKEVTRLYREQPPNYKDQAQRLYNEWVKLHPEHKKRKPHSLQNQMRVIIKNTGEDIEIVRMELPNNIIKLAQGSNKPHNWTRAENAELLHIHCRLKGDNVVSISGLHECWEKMNPHLSHLRGRLLLNRVTKLFRRGYEPSETEDEKARMKFDEKISAKEVSDIKKKQRKVVKGKSKIDPAAEHPENESPRLQESQPYPFYNFMFVDRYHGESSRNFDKDAQSTHMASSSQTPYHNLNTALNLGYYHRKESSNPPSHQQSDPEPSSPPQSTPRPFLRFF